MTKPTKKRKTVKNTVVQGKKLFKPMFERIMTRSRGNDGCDGDVVSRTTVVKDKASSKELGKVVRNKLAKINMKPIGNRNLISKQNKFKPSSNVNKDQNNNAQKAAVALECGKVHTTELPREKFMALKRKRCEMIKNSNFITEDGETSTKRSREVMNDGIQVQVHVDPAEEEELDYSGDEVDEEDSMIMDEPPVQNEDTGLDESVSGDREEDPEKLLNENPKLAKLFNHVLNKRFDQYKKQHENGSAGKASTSKNEGRILIQVKSPSDTTLYKPALRKLDYGEVIRNSTVVNNTPINREARMNADASVNEHVISNFVEAIRQETDQIDRNEQREEDMRCDSERRGSAVVIPGLEEARNKTQRSILEAEKFRAKIASPPGIANMVVDNGMMGDNLLINSNNDDNRINVQNQVVGRGISDDDFFHLTCHVEPNLQQKIERGEFVDLDKLLPKNKVGAGGVPTNEDRFEWVNRDGETFLVPATSKDSKITGIKKWEQAFRVYATIYCGANPNRSREIWQYVSVIHTAASTFLWDNVAQYDYTFRHLMAFNPLRSWALTYNQMWNICMKDPISRAGNGQFGGGSTNYTQNKSFGQGSSKKPSYCWAFNKNVKCKFGKSCKFVERCSYCDKASHGVISCPKLERKDFSTSKKSKSYHGNGGSTSKQDK